MAILLVVAFHAEIPGFRGGFIGVDIFFVISGYLIVGLLNTELVSTGRIRWGAFFARRVRRLVPAAVLMTAVVVGMSMFLLDPLGERQSASKAGIAALLSASNVFFWKVAPVDYFTAGTIVQPFLHTWSLSVEEQFYVCLPLAVGVAALVSSRLGWPLQTAVKVLLVVASAMSLGVAVWAAETHAAAGFYLLPARAYEFGLGGAIAMFAPALQGRRSHRLLGPLGWAVLGACLIFPLPEEGFPGAWGLLPVGVAVALIVSGREESISTSLLRRSSLVCLGQWSYSWYLWHWPLLALAAAVNLGPLRPAANTLVVLVALVPAIVSFYLVEEPVRRRVTMMTGSGALRSSSVLVAGCALLAGTAAAAGAVGWMSKDERSKAPWVSLTLARDDVPVLPNECLPDDGTAITSAGTRCVIYRSAPSRPTVVVWGDSHAWHLIPGVRHAVAGARLNMVSWVAGGCPAFSTESLDAEPQGGDAIEQDAYQECVEHNRSALHDIRSMAGEGQVRVVLGGRWPLYLGEEPISLIDQPAMLRRSFVPENYRIDAGLPALVDELAKLGVAVDLVAPVPEMERWAPDCEAQLIPRIDCDVPITRELEYQKETSVVLETALERGLIGSRLVDLSGELCTQDVCLAQTDGTLNYFDDDHLSATRSLALAHYFEATVDALSG